jgi:carbonic anhydrase/acetyltransferase-like protein (isoleucine patch superfamily)
MCTQVMSIAVVTDRIIVILSGANCVLKACTIEDTCYIEDNCILEEGSYVESGSILTAGSVLKAGARVGENEVCVRCVCGFRVPIID